MLLYLKGSFYFGFDLGFFVCLFHCSVFFCLDFCFVFNAYNVTKKYLNLNITEGTRLQDSRYLKAKVKLFLQHINY